MREKGGENNLNLHSFSHFFGKCCNILCFAVAEPAFCPAGVYVCGVCGQWADSPGLLVVLTPCGEAEWHTSSCASFLRLTHYRSHLFSTSKRLRQKQACAIAILFVCACVCVNVRVCKRPVLFFQEMVHKWPLSGFLTSSRHSSVCVPITNF